MKIAFVLPDVDSYHKLPIHFGIGYLAGFLKRNGYTDIRFFAITSVANYPHLATSVAEYKPDVVGFTSVETQFTNVVELSKRIKRLHKCIIVCGGTFTTLYPEAVKDAQGLDGIFIGESERAFLEFIRKVEGGEDFRETKNFCYYDRDSGQIVRNDLIPLDQDLDSIGPPDREIFDFQKVIENYWGSAPFLFNRGCPYNCAFCSNHALAEVYGKKSNATRRRSVDSCISEIEEANLRYAFKDVHIWDDLFTSDRTWLYDFLGKYRARINKPFMCTTRSNLCDDELFRTLKEHGCCKIHMALESGNEFIRNKILNRNISQETVVRSFALARKHGIRINASSIIGIPFETEEMIRETIALLGKLRIEDMGVNVFYPYRGTRLREVCVQYGLISADGGYNVRERREGILELPHLPREKLEYYRSNFERLVRRHHSPLAYATWEMKRSARAVLTILSERNK